MAIQEMLLSLTEYLTSLSFISYNDTIKNERRLAVKLPCGSASINNTFFPCLANPTPRFKVVVLFATPPFWFATDITFPKAKAHNRRQHKRDGFLEFCFNHCVFLLEMQKRTDVTQCVRLKLFCFSSSRYRCCTPYRIAFLPISTQR